MKYCCERLGGYASEKLGSSHSAADGLSEVDETGHGGFGSMTLIDLPVPRAYTHCTPRDLHSTTADVAVDGVAYKREPVRLAAGRQVTRDRTLVPYCHHPEESLLPPVTGPGLNFLPVISVAVS